MTDQKNISYNAIDTFLTSKDDYIILGLCGKTGSGATTVSTILSNPFDKLDLPKPTFLECTEDFEYQILYKYAEKNWRPFYRVKSSALITAHIMDEKKEGFFDFLEKIDGSINRETIEKLLKSFFFDQKMDVSLEDEIEIEDTLLEENLEYLFINDENPFKAKTLDTFYIRPMSSDPLLYKVLFCNAKYEYRKENKKGVFSFSTKDLYEIYKYYKKRREEKTGFNNPLLNYLMKKFIFEFLPKKSSEFWKEIKRINSGVEIVARQQLGNNLRISGKPYDSQYNPEAYNTVVRDVSCSINILSAYLGWRRKYKNDENYKKRIKIKKYGSEMSDSCFVVIDSIKNPYESKYLKSRYTNYYLMGIYTDEKTRANRLKELPKERIKEIDTIEQLGELKKKFRKLGEENTKNRINEKSILYAYQVVKENNLEKVLPFVFQHIEKCLDDADIFINNEEVISERDGSMSNILMIPLKKIILRYICLMMNPGIVLPTEIERSMQFAYTAKLNSGCISRQVGAAITDEKYHLLSVGWNQQPEEQVPCLYRDVCSLWNSYGSDKDWRYSEYEKNPSKDIQKRIKISAERYFNTDDCPLGEIGKFPSYCFKELYNSIEDDKNQVHTRSLHGEETAFLNLGDRSAREGKLFTTSSPCELCAKKAMYMGIKEIYYIEHYAGRSFDHILKIGKFHPTVKLFTGAIGLAYTKLYTPLMPLKDELELWLGEKMSCIINMYFDSEHSEGK